MQCVEGSVSGTVTSIDTDTASFEVDSNMRVYMGFYISQMNESQKLPEVGTAISIKPCHKLGSVFVPCKCSSLEGNFTMNCELSSFVNLIVIHKLGASDIFKLDEIRKFIEKNFTSMKKSIRVLVALHTLQNLIMSTLREQNTSVQNHSCQNTVISHLSLTNVRSCKYVEIQSDKFNSFPYWSFGSHPSKTGHYLFGFLEIQPVYGFYMIKDSHYQIVCVVITDNGNWSNIDETRLANSYVLIKEYNVFTEIYNDKTPNVEYIVANIKDITVIYSQQKRNSLFGLQIEFKEEENIKNCMSFILLKKSTVCVGSSNLPELLLHVFQRFTDSHIPFKEMFLILPNTYVSINMYFKEGNLYMLHHNGDLKEVLHPELTRIKDIEIFEVPERGCFFNPIVGLTLNLPQPLNLSQCRRFIVSSTELLSFRGIVERKTFSDPLPSRTENKAIVYGFGTPGPKVHQIRFRNCENDFTVHLECYLNNWENMLMPLGLLPEMEVIVRHVYPQSERYLKSSIFTTFEVVSYNPLVNFSTINLFKDSDLDWGQSVILSLGRNVPFYAHVWGEVFSLFIHKFSIIWRCSYCYTILYKLHKCTKCCNIKRMLEFYGRFAAIDQCGQSLVMTRSIQVLLAILNVKHSDFKDWIMTYHDVGVYEYSNFGVNPAPPDHSLTKCLHGVQRSRITLDLKCRRLENRPGSDQKKPVWWAIDGRRR